MPKYWEKKICGIYKITNKENGMCYIGLSVHILKRWNSHVSTKKKYKIHEAFQQFGIDAFSFEVVEECDKKELRKREKWWIDHLDCVWPKGYNMNNGGGGTIKHSKETKKKMSQKLSGKKNPFFGKKHTEETRRKISEKSKGHGKPHSEESKKNLSEKMSGKGHPMYGKKLSEERKNKISQAIKAKPKFECPHCGKLVAKHILSQWHGDKCKHRDTTLDSGESSLSACRLT